MIDFTQGVRFGNFHSYDDWGLILESDSVTFPSSEGVIDDMQVYGIPSLDPRVTHGHGKLQFNFGIVDPDRWPTILQMMTNALQGKKLEVIRDCEPDYTYLGRCKVSKHSRSLRISKIVVEVDCEPYKYATTETQVVLDGIAGVTHALVGSRITPVTIEITPKVSQNQLILTGLSRNPHTGAAEDITIDVLTQNTKIIIDGVNKLVTEGGANAYGKVSMWNFPTLIPGNNLIGVSNNNNHVLIKYKGRYM